MLLPFLLQAKALAEAEAKAAREAEEEVNHVTRTTFLLCSCLLHSSPSVFSSLLLLSCLPRMAGTLRFAQRAKAVSVKVLKNEVGHGSDEAHARKEFAAMHSQMKDQVTRSRPDLHTPSSPSLSRPPVRTIRWRS